MMPGSMYHFWFIQVLLKLIMQHARNALDVGRFQSPQPIKILPQTIKTLSICLHTQQATYIVSPHAACSALPLCSHVVLRPVLYYFCTEPWGML